MQAQISYYSGFADEAGFALETQIRATREIGWRNIEMRNVEVPGFPAANLHDISDEAFEVLVDTLPGGRSSTMFRLRRTSPPAPNVWARNWPG